MDQLTQDCIAARKAGMTYGKWKALQPRVEVVMPKQEEKKPVAKKELPKRVCRYCGKEFTGDNGNSLYCGYDCSYEAQKVRQKANYKRKKEGMMAVGKI